MRSGNSIYQIVQWEDNTVCVAEKIYFSEVYVIDVEWSSVLFAIVERYRQAILSELTSTWLNKNHSLFFFSKRCNTDRRCFSLSPAAVVNLPIAESEHHNFCCRVLRPKRYFFHVSFVRVARATKDAIIAKPCMRSDRSFSRVFREQTTMHRAVEYCCERRLVFCGNVNDWCALIFQVKCDEFNFRSMRKNVLTLTAFALLRGKREFGSRCFEVNRTFNLNYLFRRLIRYKLRTRDLYRISSI